MKFSYRDLEKYFAEPLPPVEQVVEAVLSHAFEVEEIVPVGNDWELEIKILPDRAPDAKTPHGFAQELSALLDRPLRPEFISSTEADNARTKISFQTSDIVGLIGVEISELEIIDYLKRLRIVVEKDGGKLVALIPADRLDLNIKEDLADEVGRLYGVNKIKVVSLPTVAPPTLNPNFELANKVKEMLLDDGYSEIYGYTFTDHGEVEVAKPLASDKAWLRTNLSEGMKKTIEFNLQNVIFDTEEVKLFEIGTVFIGSQEEIRVAVGSGSKKPKLKIEVTENKLSDWVNKVPSRPADLDRFIKPEFKFESFSVYPRILRDVALFVPDSEEPETVAELIKNNAGALLMEGPYLFDTFAKEGKKSLAFRLVFQSAERTLSDEEANQAMNQVILALETKGWEVRK